MSTHMAWKEPVFLVSLPAEHNKDLARRLLDGMEKDRHEKSLEILAALIEGINIVWIHTALVERAREDA